MNPSIGRSALIAATLLGLAESPAEAEDARKADQIVLDLYAVEMSGQTLRELGLRSDDKATNKPPGGSVNDSPLLKDAKTWNAALNTAALLGAVRIQSAPTLATVTGRRAEIELHGVEFRDNAKEKSTAVQVTSKWSVTPTLTRDNKLSVEFKFRRSESDLTLKAANPTKSKPSEPVLQASSTVEIPFGKPTIVAGLSTVAATASREKHQLRAADKKPAESPQETSTLIVVTAERVPPPAPEAADSEKPKLTREVHLDLLVLDTAPDKLKAHLQSSQPPSEALLKFLEKRNQEHAKAAHPKSDKFLEELIRPLEEAKIVKVWAAPTLSSQSGRETWFQIGGEFPFPVPADDAITIQYKKYGIDFRFTPDAIAEKNVRLSVKAQHTFLDDKTATKIDTLTVPGLKTVAANSVHEVEYGQLLVFGPLVPPGAGEYSGVMIVATPRWDWGLADHSTPAPKEIRQAVGPARRKAH